MSTNSTHSSYGAFEMKASYQKNLLIGNLAVFGLVLSIISLGWVLGEPPVVVLPPIETPPHVGDPKTFEAIKHGEITIQRERTAMPIKQGTIPVMIPDSVFIDEDSTILLTIDEFVIIEGGGSELINQNESIGPNGSYGGVGDIIPDENQFVPYEKEPEMYYQVQPEYPRLCIQTGTEGDVIIKVLLDKEGNVIKSKIVKSSGNELLDKSALKVATDNKFTPALQNSIPISLWVSYTVRFRLQ